MGAPFKAPGDNLADTEWDEVVGQTIMQFASTAARDAAITSPTDGMLAEVGSIVYRYDSSGAGGWIKIARGGEVRLFANQSIPNATWTKVTVGFPDNTGSRGIPGTNYYNGANGLTVPTGLDGFHLVTAGVKWAANGTGARQMEVRLGGTAIAGQYSTGYGTQDHFSSCAILQMLPAGSALEIYVFQTSGAALNIVTTGATAYQGTHLGAVRLGGN